MGGIEARQNINQRRAAEIVAILDSQEFEPCSTERCPGARGFLCGNCGAMEFVCPCGCGSSPCNCDTPKISHSSCVYYHYGRPGKVECGHTENDSISNSVDLYSTSGG